MKIKNCVKMLLILLLTMLVISYLTNCSFAAGSSTADAISAMNGMETLSVEDESGKIGGILNGVIGIIQIAGTGISMIMVTILGIKYLLASPNDKADVKKQIAPLIIGAIILFASTNLVAIVVDFGGKILSDAANGGGGGS